MRTISKQVLVLLILITSVTFVKAQVYDGSYDKKIMVGYMNVGGLSGGELRFENGLSDLISVGVSIQMAAIKTDNTDEFDKAFSFLSKVDLGSYMNFHLFQSLAEQKNIDLFLGGFVSFKSYGLQGGVKYNFNETIGVYGNYSHSLGALIFPVDDPDFLNVFANQPLVSVGITFNIY